MSQRKRQKRAPRPKKGHEKNGQKWLRFKEDLECELLIPKMQEITMGVVDEQKKTTKARAASKKRSRKKWSKVAEVQRGPSFFVD